jgi:hypothetical protein
MATIITKNSQTASAVPSAGSLSVGELAVNTADGKLYTKHSDNSVKALSPTLNELLPSQTGNSGKVLGTNGSTTSWVASAPESLAKTFTLKSGATLAAGRAVNINSSGQVGDYPVVNTLGTVVNNASYLYYNISLDGSRGITLSNSGSATVTVRGHAITGSAVTNGTTTVSGSISGNQGYSWTTTALNETTFVVFGHGVDGCGQTTYFKAFAVQVDASGNCTKGNEFSTSNASTYFSIGIFIGKFINGTFMALFESTGNSQVPQKKGYVVTLSGTTLTFTQKNALFNWRSYSADSNSSFAITVNSNTIAVSTSGGEVSRATWDGTNFGTVTTTNIYSSGVNRAQSIFLSQNLIAQAETLPGNQVTVRIHSVDQTTGITTLLSSKILDTSLSQAGSFTLILAKESATKFVVTMGGDTPVAVYPVEIDGSGNIIGTGVKILGSFSSRYIYYTGTGSVYRIFDLGDATKNSQNVTINSYNTPSWNFAGISQTSQTTSPASLITAGVANGFTGLTPGTRYYVNTDLYNGTLTTAVTTSLVGLAVSSTEILIGA